MLNLRRRPVVTASELGTGLEALGLNGTQHVIVHASLRSFGQLEGGAKTVVDQLFEHSATVVAPSFSYDTLLPRASSPIQVTFNRDTRVSYDIGRVSQEMVERSAARRSFHPALSFVALGAEAEPITRAQSLNNPYRPIGALYDLDGYVLLMGVGFDSNTTIHYGEHVAGVPLLTRWLPLNGEVRGTAFPNCSANFGVLEPYVRGKEVKVGSSQLRMFKVRELVNVTSNLLKHDPEALLCKDKTCRCQQVRDHIRKEGLTPRPHQGIHISIQDTDELDEYFS